LLRPASELPRGSSSSRRGRKRKAETTPSDDDAPVDAGRDGGE